MALRFRRAAAGARLLAGRVPGRLGAGRGAIWFQARGLLSAAAAAPHLHGQHAHRRRQVSADLPRVADALGVTHKAAVLNKQAHADDLG